MGTTQELPATATEAGSVMLEVERGRVRPNPAQPRKWFDPDAHAELVASIRRNGVLQPLRLRVDPEDPVGYLIIAGERRWRASGEVGLERLPAVIADVTSERVTLLQATTENVTRRDMTPIEEAQAFADLVGYGMTPETVGEELGKTPAFIRARMALLDLIPQAQEAVAKGLLPLTLAVKASGLENDAQSVLLTKWIRGEWKDVAAAMEYIAACRAAMDQPVMFGLQETYPQTEARKKAAVAAANSNRPLRAATEACYRLARLETDAFATGLTDEALGQLQDEVARLASGLTELRAALRRAVAHREAAAPLFEVPDPRTEIPAGAGRDALFPAN